MYIFGLTHTRLRITPLAGSAAILCIYIGGLDVIRKDAWPFYRTISGVRLYWVLEEPKGPKGPQESVKKTQGSVRQPQDSVRKTQDSGRRTTQDSVRRNQESVRRTQDSVRRTQVSVKKPPDSIRKTQDLV